MSFTYSPLILNFAPVLLGWIIFLLDWRYLSRWPVGFDSSLLPCPLGNYWFIPSWQVGGSNFVMCGLSVRIVRLV